MRKYRLEIAVKRLYGLLNMSSSARIVFSVRFSTFPEIFIRPQQGGGGGVIEASPAGDRILSLTYCVCHKAEFQLDDNEIRRLFPAECFCRLYDENQIRTSGASIESVTAAASLTWVCPCPLMTERAADSRQHANYAMCDANGQIMGYAEMSCRVVTVNNISSPSVSSSPACMSIPTTTGPSTLPTSNGHLIMNGKPYVIRVIVDNKENKKKKKIKSTKSDHHSSSGVITSGEETGTVVAVNDPSLEKKGTDSQNYHGESKNNVIRSRSGSKNRGGGGRRIVETVGTAKKKTLLYILQYDVAYQIQSNCGTLYATLKREFTPLNAVTVNEKSKPMIDKVDNLVQGISKLANIALQLANQLAESAGESYTNVSSDEKTRRNPVNKLPIPREGSVAHFLMYQVLFQLQCLGTSLCYVTAVYHQPLEVQISSLHHQHVKFIKKLAVEVQELTKYINIIVQSTIDGTFGSNKVLSSRSTSTYSSSFSSSSSSNSSSSRSSSSARSEGREGSSVESVPNVPLDDKKAPSVSFPVAVASVPQPLVQEQSNTQITKPPVYQGYTSTPYSSSSLPTPGGYSVSTVAPPGDTLSQAVGANTSNFLPSQLMTTPSTTDLIGRDLSIHGTTSAAPPTSFVSTAATAQQGTTFQNALHFYSSTGGVPAAQPVQPSSGVNVSAGIKQPPVISGGVPAPQPVQPSSGVNVSAGIK
ncbi:uncharacterized protein TM35_000043270, partial [Trypanosoma theileri]